MPQQQEFNYYYYYGVGPFNVTDPRLATQLPTSAYNTISSFADSYQDQSFNVAAQKKLLPKNTIEEEFTGKLDTDVAMLRQGIENNEYTNLLHAAFDFGAYPSLTDVKNLDLLLVMIARVLEQAKATLREVFFYNSGSSIIQDVNVLFFSQIYKNKSVMQWLPATVERLEFSSYKIKLEDNEAKIFSLLAKNCPNLRRLNLPYFMDVSTQFVPMMKLKGQITFPKLKEINYMVMFLSQNSNVGDHDYYVTNQIIPLAQFGIMPEMFPSLEILYIYSDDVPKNLRIYSKSRNVHCNVQNFITLVKTLQKNKNPSKNLTVQLEGIDLPVNAEAVANALTEKDGLVIEDQS